jgi:mRNA interferase RelE/StbE
MTYRVEVTRSAVKALRRVNAADTARLRGAIAMLAEDPRPPASRPLRGRDGWRLRVGDYRVIYTIRDDVPLIVVVAVAHRSSAYR